MKKINRILIATDLSDLSTIAFRRGIEFAKHFKAKITVLNVILDKRKSAWWKDLIPPLRKQIMTPEEQIKERIKQKILGLSPKGLKIEVVIVNAKKPGVKIVNYAKNKNFDLLIIGAHGHYSLHDWLTGTTSEYIAKKISCPVLIIKRKHRAAYKNILLPIDFSVASKAAVIQAFHWFPQAHFYVLNVGDKAYDDLIKSDYVHTYGKGKQLKKELLHLLTNKSKNFVTQFNKRKNVSYNVKIGYPGSIILKEAKKEAHSLIIMGTQGHSERYYNWLGSVANRVLVEANKDILLVPAIKKRQSATSPQSKNSYIKKLNKLTEDHFKELKELAEN